MRKGQDSSLMASSAPKMGKARWTVNPSPSLSTYHSPRSTRVGPPHSKALISLILGGQNLPRIRIFQKIPVSSQGGHHCTRPGVCKEKAHLTLLRESCIREQFSCRKHLPLLALGGAQENQKDCHDRQAAVPNMQNLLINPSAC